VGRRRRRIEGTTTTRLPSWLLSGSGHVGADLGEAVVAGGSGGGVCGLGAELPSAGREGAGGVASGQSPRPPAGCGHRATR